MDKLLGRNTLVGCKLGILVKNSKVITVILSKSFNIETLLEELATPPRNLLMKSHEHKSATYIDITPFNRRINYSWL